MKENAFTYYVRDDELYNQFKAAAREDKLPVLDNKTFERMNNEYGKEKMRKHLADYIATERPVFPLTEITKETMREHFHLLQKFDTNTICIPNEQVEKDVFEKYDDYKYPYSKYGLFELLTQLPKSWVFIDTGAMLTSIISDLEVIIPLLSMP